MATPFEDWSATSVLPSAPLSREGEVQFAFFGRSIFQRLRPVAASRPAVNDSLSFSTCATSTPSATTSDDDMPSELLALG